MGSFLSDTFFRSFQVNMFISRFMIQLRYLLLLMYYLPYILYNVLVLTPTFMWSAALNKPCSVHCVGNFSPAVGARNQVGIGLSYWPASLCSLTTQSQTWFLELILRPIVGVSLSDGDLLIGPCRSQRLGRRQELAIGQAGPGTKGIIGKVPGPRVHPVL
jgi:hypothetical protein